METENDEYGRQERIALVAIVVAASLTVASLLVAFSYYCYIRNKLSKRLKNHSSKSPFVFSSENQLSLFVKFAASVWLLENEKN
jgi:amino acid permease